MKYIVTLCEDGKEDIFIFSERIHHDCMMEALQGIRNQSWGEWGRKYREPIAAGFTDGAKCWGHSETLDIGSRGQADEVLIK